MSLTGQIRLLPPKGHKSHLLAYTLLLAGVLGCGILALFLGQDANWDLRNYHFYNGYAFLNGRYGFDLLPSQTPYFYNPLLDVPFYLLATHAPAMAVGFVLGCLQGINFILLFMLAYSSLLISNPLHKILTCAALAALGVLGGGGIAQIGTTFYDNVTSLGLFTSALLIIRHSKTLLKKPTVKVFLRALLFGIPAGLMMGLKLPSFIFCVGLCVALLFVTDFKRSFLLSLGFGLGVLVGFSITYGYWAWFLSSHFGNPLFPYFNDYFKAPLAPFTSARDMQFIPNNLKDKLLFPFIFAEDPKRVGEIPWRDWRIPMLYVLLPLAVAVRLFFGNSRNTANDLSSVFATRYLLWVGVISYIAWLLIFSIYRYAIPLEMLTPLLIVLAVGLLPLKMQTRALIAGFLVLVIAASIQPGNWYRRQAWLDHFVEAKIPELGETSNLMILMAGFEPYSHIVTQFPADIRFVRIQSNFASPNQNKGINAVIRKKVEAHRGRFMLLIPPYEHHYAHEALNYFDLMVVVNSCETVVDRLYDDNPLDLCEVRRVN